MQLNNINKVNKNRKARRIGRGGKRGTYSGRGIKGQNSRAGARIRPDIRDFIKRTPKLRGEKFSGMPKTKTIVINIKILNTKFKKGGFISPKVLYEANIIPSSKTAVKILAIGDPVAKFNIHKIKVSKAAKTKIEKAGGLIEV